MRLILLVLFLFVSEFTNSCNLCWDYKIKDPRLQRQTIDHDNECNCQCWQYPHTEGDNNFYRCQVCGHRITPPNPASKNGPQYKRFYHKGEKKFKPTSFKYPLKSPEKNPRPLIKTNKLDFSRMIKTTKKI